MLKFSVFFNIVVYNDYNNFPKLRLGVSVLTILYNLFISELFKRNAKTQKSFEKIEIFKLTSQ